MIFRSGFITAEILEVFSSNPEHYRNQIRVTAIAGPLLSFVLYAALTFWTITFKHSFLSGIFLAFLVMEVISFVTAKGDQCDRELIKNPENYRYEIPEWVKELSRVQ